MALSQYTFVTPQPATNTQQLEEYQRSVNAVISSIAIISTSFTSIAAATPLNLPPHLSRSLNADVKHISRSILPGLEILFAETKTFVEQRVMKEIYPEFVKHQLSICMRNSLSATRATASTFNFEYPGLGDAFCLTDPYKADNPIVVASDGFVNCSGYSRPEIIPRNCRFLQGPRTDGQTVKRMKLSISQNRESVDLVLNYRKDGQPFWNLLYICPLKGPNGKVRFFFGGQINVSETIGSHKDVLQILNGAPPPLKRPESKAAEPAGLDSPTAEPVAVRKSRKLERGGSIRSRTRVDENRHDRSEKVSSAISFRNPFRRHNDQLQSPPPSRQGPAPTMLNRLENDSTPGLEQTLYSRSMTNHLSLSTQIDEFCAVYSRFMLLQFVPTTSYGDVVPVRGRNHAGARLKVGFCSTAVLETLGLSPGAQEAVLYHDVFSVLSELAGSPSITSIFRHTVRERLCLGESVSLELLVSSAADEAGAPGSGGSGRKGSIIALGSRSRGGDDKSSKRRSQNVEKLMERRTHAESGSPGRQRLMSHWIPLKDAEGSVVWVVLVVTPVVT
jgi:phototropin